MNTKPDVTCRDCQHAEWNRTPTGRIRNDVGRCRKEAELLQRYTATAVPPCLVGCRVVIVRIWPDYDASGCPLRVVAPKEAR